MSLYTSGGKINLKIATLTETNTESDSNTTGNTNMGTDYDRAPACAGITPPICYHIKHFHLRSSAFNP